MTRVLDVLAVTLLLGGAGCFALGIAALSGQRDLEALYWAAVGALALRSAVELLRPRSG